LCFEADTRDALAILGIAVVALQQPNRLSATV
jgi:hypothetical protein